MKRDDGSILVGDGFRELQRRSENGVWGSEAVRPATFEALKRAGKIKYAGLTGGTTTPDSMRFEIWKLAE